MAVSERLARLWLSQADLSGRVLQAVARNYDHMANFYEDFSPAMEKMMGQGAYHKLQDMRHEDKLSQLAQAHQTQGIKLLHPGDDLWPEALSMMEDSPLWLYVMGDAKLLAGDKAIAIVGTRYPSRYGRDMAYQMGYDLGMAGITVVSGFARGVDAAAHEGCLEAKGPTVAVMGCGLDTTYPAENGKLREKLLNQGGLMVSEYPMGALPLSHHFPQRNRIISALCKGVLLVEGQLRSGGMITVRHALEQGREVFALPGQVTSRVSQAPHAIIRDGARLITSARDMMEDMGWEQAPMKDKAQQPHGLAPEQQALVDLIFLEEQSFEELAEKTGLAMDKLNSHLTMLELMGIIKKSPGRIYVKA